MFFHSALKRNVLVRMLLCKAANEIWNNRNYPTCHLFLIPKMEGAEILNENFQRAKHRVNPAITIISNSALG